MWEDRGSGEEWMVRRGEEDVGFLLEGDGVD